MERRAGFTVTKWILIIYIATDLWLPKGAYNTEDQCYAALERMEIKPPMRGTCLPGVIEKERRQK
jgi:hypothetical protein